MPEAEADLDSCNKSPTNPMRTVRSNLASFRLVSRRNASPWMLVGGGRRKGGGGTSAAEAEDKSKDRGEDEDEEGDRPWLGDAGVTSLGVRWRKGSLDPEEEEGGAGTIRPSSLTTNRLRWEGDGGRSEEAEAAEAEA